MNPEKKQKRTLTQALKRMVWGKFSKVGPHAAAEAPRQNLDIRLLHINKVVTRIS